MTRLNEILTVSINEGAVIDFESSLDKDPVVSGYVPVKSTLEVFNFLKQAAAPQAPQGRAVICHGSYGSGKSRLCTVLARLFRDGFNSPALEPVWNRLIAREEQEALSDLRQTLQPGGGAWRPLARRAIVCTRRGRHPFGVVDPGFSEGVASCGIGGGSPRLDNL